MVVKKTKAIRRKFDFYPTQTWGTEILIENVPIQGNVFECCSGEHHITNVLRTLPKTNVYTNDINPNCEADYHVDLTQGKSWDQVGERPNWIVTNPPFKYAVPIVKGAYKHTTDGIAMFLRLSFLEPCENRKEFLKKHPPTNIIVLPRMSFTGNRSSDTVTCAWMIWDKSQLWQNDAIKILSKD